MVEAITGYEGIGVTNCTYNNPMAKFQPNQVSDICCNSESQGAGTSYLSNNYVVGSYWSVKDAACVIPESWQNFWTNDDQNGSGGSWFSPAVAVPPGATYTALRQASGGSDGVAVTGSDDNIYFYSQSLGDWLGEKPPFCIRGQPCWSPVALFSPAAQVAAGGGTLAEVRLDALDVSTYPLSQGINGSWSGLGTPLSEPITGVVVTGNGVVVVTDTLGQPWYWDSGEWIQFGGPGDQFVASGPNIIALTPDHYYVNEWPGANFGPGGYWVPQSVEGEGGDLGFPVNLTGSPDASDWAIQYGGNQTATTSTSGSAIITNAFDLAVTSVYGANVQWATPRTDATYAGYVGSSQFSTGGTSGRLISGAALYATGCASGALPDCVNY